MKNGSRTVLIFLLGMFLFCGNAEGTEWKVLGKSNIGTYYYDRYGAKQLPGNVVRVLVKMDYSAEGVREVRDAFPFIDGSLKISYTLYTYEVKCYADSFRIVRAETYDSSGSAIRGTGLDYIKTGQSSWDHITPGSRVARLSDESCRYLLYDRR